MISDLFSLPNLAKGVAKLYSGLGYFHLWGMKSPKGVLLSHTVKSLGLRTSSLGKSMSQRHFQGLVLSRSVFQYLQHVGLVHPAT